MAGTVNILIKLKPGGSSGSGGGRGNSVRGSFTCNVDSDVDCRCDDRGRECCDASRRCKDGECCEACGRNDGQCTLCDNRGEVIVAVDDNVVTVIVVDNVFAVAVDLKDYVTTEVRLLLLLFKSCCC